MLKDIELLKILGQLYCFITESCIFTHNNYSRTQNGVCADTLTETISVLPFTSYFIPNSFTPNGDGLNEKFGIRGTGIETADFELAIYNRWGELIFKSNELTRQWDGRMTTGIPAQDGVYVYALRLRLKNKQEIIKTNGNLSLYR